MPHAFLRLPSIICFLPPECIILPAACCVLWPVSCLSSPASCLLSFSLICILSPAYCLVPGPPKAMVKRVGAGCCTGKARRRLVHGGSDRLCAWMSELAAAAKATKARCLCCAGRQLMLMAQINDETGRTVRWWCAQCSGFQCWRVDEATMLASHSVLMESRESLPERGTHCVVQSRQLISNSLWGNGPAQRAWAGWAASWAPL
jgi:hypothetical protein